MKSTRQKKPTCIFKMTRGHDLDTPHTVPNNRQGRKLMSELLSEASGMYGSLATNKRRPCKRSPTHDPQPTAAAAAA